MVCKCDHIPPEYGCGWCSNCNSDMIKLPSSTLLKETAEAAAIGDESSDEEVPDDGRPQRKVRIGYLHSP